MVIQPADRTRDAHRSRSEILTAAEYLFSAHGYDGTSLADIAALSGLSRGTPSYFFGSKEKLYIEVLDLAFTARQTATVAAFRPVHAWCDGVGGRTELSRALGEATGDYLSFLARKPGFVRLLVQEELAGGKRIRRRRAPSTALEDAFEALRREGPGRALRPFAGSDAMLLFIALTFAPVSYRNTLMRAVDRNLNSPSGRQAQVRLVVDQLMHLIAAEKPR